jgi:DNA-binding transcriptional LysR family regulator
MGDIAAVYGEGALYMLLARRFEEFLAVARAGSLSEAARQLYVSQPTLTVQMRKLEQELGAELFVRSSHGVELTAAGNALRRGLEAMGKVEGEVLESVRQAGGAARALCVGVVGTSEVKLLEPALEEFRALYPGTAITFKRVGHPIEERKRLLGDGTIDCFMAAMRQGDIRDVMFVPFYEDRDCLVMRPDDPLAGRTALSPADLGGRTIVVPRENPPSSLETVVCQAMREGNPSINLAERNVDTIVMEEIRYSDELFLSSETIGHLLGGMVCVPLIYQGEPPTFGMVVGTHAPSEAVELARLAAQTCVSARAISPA